MWKVEKNWEIKAYAVDDIKYTSQEMETYLDVNDWVPFLLSDRIHSSVSDPGTYVLTRVDALVSLTFEPVDPMTSGGSLFGTRA